jgi:hypothetical protein
MARKQASKQETEEAQQAWEIQPTPDKEFWGLFFLRTKTGWAACWRSTSGKVEWLTPPRNVGGFGVVSESRASAAGRLKEALRRECLGRSRNE